MAKLIGTAGHVDHGKTTLIRALTGIDADRLPEEKRRGMTIDIGFAYIDLPNLGRISIVDVPGHERFLHNMLVGALGIDLALLCVSADEGVKAQTREHLQILELLPVGSIVVALTRADLADETSRQITRLDVETLLASTRFKNAPIVAVSAMTGEGLDELRALLAEPLSARPLNREGAWYLPIDRAFTVKGQGCVVTGPLARGRLKLGEPAILSPGGREVRIRAIRSHGVPLEEAQYGQRIALNLSGIKAEDLRRGQVVSAPGAVFDSDIFDVNVHWLVAPKHSQRIRVSIGAEEAIGRVFLSDKNPGLAQIRLEATIACAVDQPFILRRYSPPDLLGGGTVAIPQAKARRKKEDVLIVEGSEAGPERQIMQVLDKAGKGVPTEELCRQLGKTPQDLGSPLEGLSQSGKALGFGGLWFSQAPFADERSRFLEALGALHAEHPARQWQPREGAVSRACLAWSGKPLDRILSSLAAHGDIILEGTQVRLATFMVRLSEKPRAFLDRVIAALDAGGLNAPASLDVARVLSVPPQAVDEIVKVGVQAGEIVRLPDGILYSSNKLERIKALTLERFNEEPFTAAEFRDRMETSRKFAVALLEHLDAVGFTLRTGDKRVIKGPAGPEPPNSH